MIYIIQALLSLTLILAKTIFFNNKKFEIICSTKKF